ncbi:Oxidoreductase [Raoultella ornithinolytica]|nr:Oxidoreductase [Raoultella ornithinolytica]
MNTRPLGKTGFSIAPLVFGGNVFGWTCDEKTSFAILDAFVDHGFDAIDTADVYSRWADGNQGGESETLIGRWLQARPGMRDKVKIFTKVGSDLGLPGQKGLKKAWIQQAVENSLRRLNTDYIDLYFAHWPDPETPIAETLSAFHALQQAGKFARRGLLTWMPSSFPRRWKWRGKRGCRPGRCCNRNTTSITAPLLRGRCATCASAGK